MRILASVPLSDRQGVASVQALGAFRGEGLGLPQVGILALGAALGPGAQQLRQQTQTAGHYFRDFLVSWGSVSFWLWGSEVRPEIEHFQHAVEGGGRIRKPKKISSI